MAANVAISTDVAARLIAELSRQHDELHRVARVLHEETGQILTVVGLQLDVLRQDFRDQVPDLGERTTEIQQMLEKAIDGVRQLSYSLNPDRVQRSGLRYALDLLVGQARERSEVNIRFLMDSHVHVPLPVAVAFYRITECALDNALRHSGAQHVEIVLQPAPHTVRLEVKDNGIGFSVEETERNVLGTGLLWMRHLAQANTLDLRISSRIGGGTVVQAVHREPEVGPVGG
jgi:signal transduction histidine kinase